MPGGGLEFSCEKPKERHNDNISAEQVMKSLSSLGGVEEKLAALGRKYSELLDEHKATQTQLKNNQRSLQVLSREKEQLQSEHGKVVLAKSKLESLCRELQRHNKLVKDESLARAKEDDEKRKEITSRFQVTINDIQQQMSDHYEKNTALREENMELANKLKGLIEQYELREKQIDKIIETKEIETQLYDAKLQQAALQISEEKEKQLHDKQLLMKEVLESQQKMLLMEEQEKALRAQVTMYTDKYDEFQSTLTKSNDVFSNFKSEMDKMTKKMKKLEKDTTMWKQKWEGGQRALIEMAEQKASSDKGLMLQLNKVSKLESLCRALQEERRLSTAAASASSAAVSLTAATDAAAAAAARCDATAAAAATDQPKAAAAASESNTASTAATVTAPTAAAAVSESSPAAAADNTAAAALAAADTVSTKASSSSSVTAPALPPATSEPSAGTSAPVTGTDAPTASTAAPATSTDEPATSTDEPATSTAVPTTSTDTLAASTAAPTNGTSAPTTGDSAVIGASSET